MARGTTSNVTALPVTEKAARRTPAQIQQAILDATNEKLEAAKAQKERAQESERKADEKIEYLTALAENQANHPALKKAAVDGEPEADVVTEPAGDGVPVADA